MPVDIYNQSFLEILEGRNYWSWKILKDYRRKIKTLLLANRILILFVIRQLLSTIDSFLIYFVQFCHVLKHQTTTLLMSHLWFVLLVFTFYCLYYEKIVYY